MTEIGDLSVRPRVKFFEWYNENKLLLQSDVVLDSESNVRNFSSLAPPGGEKKIIFNFFTKWRHE